MCTRAHTDSYKIRASNSDNDLLGIFSSTNINFHLPERLLSTPLNVPSVVFRLWFDLLFVDFVQVNDAIHTARARSR
jgi:predicted secreted protein